MNPHLHLIDSKRKFIFLILILGGVTAIGPLTIDMYLPAFSAIARGFNAPDNLVQLSLTTYFAGLAVSQLIYGPIIDRFGKKLPLFFGLCLFVITSIACCFVTSIEQLIVMRFFQAMGACIGVVVPRAIVRDIFSPQESARIYSHLMLVMGLAPILAPMIGSFVLVIFGWQAIFALLASFGVICLVVSYFTFPQTKKPDRDEKISNALKKYWGILHDRTFVICALSGSFVMASLFAYINASPFAYLEFFGLSSKRYSLIFALNSLGFIMMSQINAYFLKKYSIEKVLRFALLIPVVSGSVLIFVGHYHPNFWLFTVTFFVFLGSVGMIAPNTSALALSNQSKHSGSASALLGTIQFTFATLMSFLISRLHDGGISSMTIVIGVCGISSCVVYRLFHKPYLNQGHL